LKNYAIAIYLNFTFLLFATQIVLFRGFYAYDLMIVLADIFYLIKTNFFKIKRDYLKFYFFVLMLICLNFLSVIRSNNLSYEYFLVPYKLLLAVLYFYFFLNLHKNKIIIENYKWYLFGPSIISIILYFDSSGMLSNYLLLDNSKDPSRFGGVFGEDVVTYGTFNAVIASYAYFSFIKKYENKSFFILSIILMLFGTFLSLSRTGIVLFILLVTFISLVIMNFKQRIKSMLTITIIFILIILNFSSLESFIPSRFSLELFMEHAFSTDSNHVAGMYNKWLNIFFSNPTFFEVLFGFDVNWLKPDSLYLYLLGINGFLGLIIIFFQLFYVYYLNHKFSKNMNDFYLIFMFSFMLLSYKGLFVFANYYILISLFFYFKIKSYPCRKFQY
jgi:hypothetical protein